jgi:hypothetical protein
MILRSFSTDPRPMVPSRIIVSPPGLVSTVTVSIGSWPAASDTSRRVSGTRQVSSLIAIPITLTHISTRATLAQRSFPPRAVCLLAERVIPTITHTQRPSCNAVRIKMMTQRVQTGIADRYQGWQ